MAAAAKTNQPPTGRAVANCNFVAQDQIWKDHVHHEMTASKTWPNSWGFLTTPYGELVKDDIPKKEKREPVDVLQIRPVTPIEEYIKVEPSPHPFPKTTSQTVGWRSTSKIHALEKYGKYAKPKGGLVRQLNWPTEAID
ncbi:uncharacterized protein C20orf85-like [Mytilus californianus]|uniref:uncharacterized protein C20orf85-like n=1 Tax=Mytilus californianus TaxID=6549 RepID=UPI00224864DF|nr:uncharacterized protein C20orf85-like [Mytilus californianus]